MSRLPTLLLIPGLLCTERLWREQTTALADLAEAVVTRAQLEHDDLGRIARAILAQAPARFALAGLSFGGYVAFEILRQAPERVERLALLNTQARPDSAARRAERMAQLDSIDQGRFIGMSDRLVRSFVAPARVADRHLLAEIKAMAESVGREGFLRQQRAILGRPDSRPLLPTIACPTLVLTGRQDSLLPLEIHEEMAAAIPGAELAVIEDCGHLSAMERPVEVNQALRHWLQEM